MNPKTKQSLVDKAVDVSFAHIAEESGMKPMDLYMVGLGYTGVGLLMVNFEWLPTSLSVVGGLVVASGLAAMVLIARKV